ncbi:MAG: SPOR domain-containing protein, partial [Ignavibacteriaceae bacterium]
YLGKNEDKDNDGIDDDFDFCPDTPEGIRVDEFGCSLGDINPITTTYDTLKDTFISDGIFTDGKIFCFQIDVLRNFKEANSLRNNILQLDYNAEIIEMKLGGKTWYSVRIGYFKTFEIAKFYREDFFRKTKIRIK